MKTATAVIDSSRIVGAVNPRLFGALVEHMGRCVYTGIFEPNHPTSGADGIRQDVLALVRDLGTTLVRYPGGNFVSGYRWEDGIGPREERPVRLDLAWRSIESNAFGLKEFLDWADRASVEPMMVVNLGTRGILEACDLLEYTNHPGGTYWSDLRRAHGTPDGHAVRLWGLGNEMDGPWQIGHKSAQEYGRLAAETGKAMRLVDPSIELVACGSSNNQMPTFGEWESTVLDCTFDVVDYISLHAYYEDLTGDLSRYLASSVEMDRFIEGVVATADHVAARRGSSKRIMLAFDEWNIWDVSKFSGAASLDWQTHPRLIEQQYTAKDAVVVGSLLMSLLRHADRVQIACLAQLVNVIGAIRSEPAGPAWPQAIYWPFALTARHARGVSLDVAVRCELYDAQDMEGIPSCDVAATLDEQAGELVIFALNRAGETMNLGLNLGTLPYEGVVEHLVVGGERLDAVNTAASPTDVVPRAVSGTGVDDRGLVAHLPPTSWSMVRVRVGAAEGSR